jgi:hypothetical protein
MTKQFYTGEHKKKIGEASKKIWECKGKITLTPEQCKQRSESMKKFGC